MGLGILLNLAVMVANGGFMPVSPQAIVSAGLEERIEGVAVGDPVPGSKDILKQPDDTLFRPLSDVIVIKRPFTNIISIGDIITAFGLALTLGQLIVVPLRRSRTA